MPTDPRVYRFGDYELLVAERQLLRQTREVELRPKAFDTLRCLVERHGHLVRKDELLDCVWAGTSVSDAVLTHCIAEVRQALGDAARSPRFVRTVQLGGYKFIAPVTVSGPDTAVAGPESAGAGVVLASVTSSGSVGARPTPGRATIAVLPFVNLTADPENEFFCDGLSEELINCPTQVGGLRVPAHSSSFSFKGRDIDARDIGRQLNVATLLEGSVRRCGDRLRISAQLIDAAEGYHLWAETYDRQLGDVFVVQDEIARAILERLRVEWSGGLAAPLVRPSTRDMEAYRLYLRGRSFWHGRFKGQLQKAMECFEQAIEIDPAFALAYTGLADSYSTLGMWAFSPAVEVFPRAAALARQALEIDDRLGEAHASLALVHLFHDWDWRAAGERLRRAADLKPGAALIRLWTGHYLSIVGRHDEAIAAVLQAQSLDPLSPIVTANLGWTISLAGQRERAEEELRRASDVEPANGLAHFYLGYAHAELGHHREAIESFERCIEATGGMPWAAESLAWVRALAGERERARQALAEAETRRRTAYVPASGLAMIHLGLGDSGAALDWLETGADERDALMPWLASMPGLGPLRSEPRFSNLLRRIGLT